MKREKLVAKKGIVYNERNHFLFSISLTERHSEILEAVDWDSDSESWLSYTQRTRDEKSEEIKKVFQLAEDIVSAYNEKYKL